MNLDLAQWFPLVQVVGWTLLHFLWQGGLIGLGYACVRAAVPAERSEARYAAGLAALALAAICPLITCALIYPQSTAATGAAPEIYSASISLSPVDIGSSVSAQQSMFDLLLPWLVLAWTIGVGLTAWRALHQWRVLERIAKKHATISPQLERALASLAARFGLLRSIHVLISDRIDTPTLIGWIRPVILLPAAVAIGFPHQQLELILAHELGHLRRYDHLVNLAQAVLETLLFYHPVVHWISREVRNEREICCDRLVLKLTGGEPKEYARTLASLEELRVGNLKVAIAATGGVLLDRVRRIVGVPAPRLAATRPSFGLGVLAAVGLSALVIGALRPDKLEELANGAATVFDRVPRPQAIAMGDIALQLMLPSKPVVASMPKPTLALIKTAPKPAASPTQADLGESARKTAPARIEVDPLSPPSVFLANTEHAKPRLEKIDFPTDLRMSAPRIAIATPTSAAASARVRMPVALHTTIPSYPESLSAAAPIRVDVSFGISKDGTVHDVRVLPGVVEDAFATAAEKALSEWRFDPATVSSNQEVRFQQSFVFAKESDVRHRSGTPVGEEFDCARRTGSMICRRQGNEVTLPLTILESRYSEASGE